MRAYSVAVASLSINAPKKWTDNAISQHNIDGIISTQRGVARRITFPALLTLAIARVLQADLGMSLSGAIRVATGLLSLPDGREMHVGPLTISMDIAAARRALEMRLADAMESAPRPRRGRPPSRT
jgi:hypothetical protein